jgi:hypothetical protein
LRSSGVFKAYRIPTKRSVDITAYSISWVALKAINMMEKSRNAGLANNARSLSGITTALPENIPWYRMIIENRIGWDLMNISMGVLIGPRRVDIYS